MLDPGEARAAEAMVLGRAGTLTPPGLRAAISRAVMEVAPGKAKQRREHEAEARRQDVDPAPMNRRGQVVHAVPARGPGA